MFVTIITFWVVRHSGIQIGKWIGIYSCIGIPRLIAVTNMNVPSYAICYKCMVVSSISVLQSNNYINSWLKMAQNYQYLWWNGDDANGYWLKQDWPVVTAASTVLTSVLWLKSLLLKLTLSYVLLIDGLWNGFAVSSVAFNCAELVLFAVTEWWWRWWLFYD